MANVVRRADIILLRSVNTPDFQEPTYKLVTSAEADVIQLIPVKYRKFDAGDNVVEMSQAEKDAVDAAEIAANVTAVKTETIANIDIPRESGEPVPLAYRALIQNANRRINYLTNRVEELFATMDAIKNSSGGTANIRAAIPAEHPLQDTQNPLTAPANFSLIQTRDLPTAVQQYKDDIADDTVT